MVDVITTVADGIATQADVIACLALYVVDVITTQGELIVWMWCVADGMATVSKLFQL